jgi:Ca2+-binding RTX toxin-like protein
MMASIFVGSVTPMSPTRGPGDLPGFYSIINWTQTTFGSSISFSEPVAPGSNQTTTLTVQVNANGIITTVLSGSSINSGALLNFRISGLSIPLADFLAQRANIMPLLLSGADTIVGSDENNIINGGAGNDIISGLSGNDRLFGGAGNDILDGGNGADNLYGGDGNDLLKPGVNPTVLDFELADGGNGVDTISFDGSNFNMFIDLNLGLTGGISSNTSNPATVGNVTLISIENAIGGNGDDFLTGTAGVNVLSGGAGNDTLRGGAGADVLDGGAGNDTADYSDRTAGITINLTTGVAPDGDRLISIENVSGTALNDTMTGDANANRFDGGAGNDRLYGLAGNDTLNGQAGDDSLFGGLGNDVIGGGFGNDGLFGEAGNDQIYGGEGNDYIEGGDGNDVLWGQSGNDQVIAGAGNDFAVLGEGDDFFRMGAGDDRLRFDYGNGRDTVADFNLGNDVIDFTFTDMTRAVLINNAVETSQGVLLELGSGSILLAGLTWGQVDWNGSSDFIFA